MEVLSNFKYIEWLVFAFCILLITIGGSAAVNIILKKKIKEEKFTQEKLDRVNIWILRGIALFMIFTELYKHTRDLHGDGITGGFITAGEFPFVMCSMPLWLFPFVAFSGKDNKVANFLTPAAFAIGIIGGIITTFFPISTLKVGEGWFGGGFALFSTTSCIHHALMIVFPVLMLYFKIYKPAGKDICKAMIIFYGLSVVAILLNYLIPGAEYFMYDSKNLPWLSNIGAESGMAVMNLLLALVYAVFMCLIFGFWIIKDILNKKKIKKQALDDNVLQ